MSLPLERAWSYNARGAFGRASTSRFERWLLVANRKGELHAVDLETGDGAGVRGMGDALEGAPGSAGEIAIVPIDWGRYNVAAYDLLRGTYAWRTRGAAVQAGVLVDEEQVLVAPMDGHFEKREIATGDTLWTRKILGGGTVRATPVRTGPGRAFVADADGDAALVDLSDGTAVWAASLGGPVEVTPHFAENVLVVPVGTGRVVALNASEGTVRWELVAEEEGVRFASATSAEGTVYLAGTDGIVRAVDATSGSVSWTRDVGAAIVAEPAVVGELLFVGTMDERLLALDRTEGTVRWTHEVGGRIKSRLLAQQGGVTILREPHHVEHFVPKIAETGETDAE